MTRDQAKASIMEKYPDAKVLFLDGQRFTDGIGVEYKGKRNAFAITSDTGWRDAVDRMLNWLGSVK